MFDATRQSKKVKELDQETNNAIVSFIPRLVNLLVSQCDLLNLIVGVLLEVVRR